MTRGASPVGLEDLGAYLDGELDPERRDAIERHLADHPEDEAKLVEYRRRDEALRRAFAEVGSELPARAMLLRTPARGTGSVRFRVAVAAALLALMLGTGGWWYARMVDRDQALAALSREAVTAHLLYAVRPGQGRTIVENGDRLSARLSALLGAEVKAPNLSAFGFRLVGLRELAADKEPAALLVYRSDDRREVSCYFKRLFENRDTGFNWKATDGVDVIYRLDEKLGYAVVGALPRRTLQKIAEIGYRESLGEGRD